MEQGWVKIRTYNRAIEAEIVRQMLEENGVPAVLLNKQDSSVFFGKIELYVREEMQLEAIAMSADHHFEEGDEDVN